MNNKKYNDIKIRYFSRTDPRKLTIKKTNRLVKELSKIIDNYDIDNDLFAIEYEDLCEMLTRIEILALETRASLALKEDQLLMSIDKEKEQAELKSLHEMKLDSGYYQTNKSIDNIPVTVNYNDGLLEVKTPLTFKRGYKKNNFISNYLITFYVSIALKKWEEDNQKSLKNLINSPYICVMKRVDIDFSIFKNCDGDNLENQRIINEITSSCSLSDDANNMTLISVFDITEIPENTGTYFYLFSEEDIDKHKNLITKTKKTS